MTTVSAPVPLLDLKAQYATIRDEIRDAVDRVLESQQFILGVEVESLEREVATYSQCEFGIGMSSGTDAILVALMALDIQLGDQVIIPAYTFFATAGCVARLGAQPVFVDIDPQTFNIDPAKIEAAITPRTRALMPVHLFGQCAEMEPIFEIARKHNLAVIEDAAQAIGSEYKGKRAGTMGQLGCFSFFPSKNLGGIGDGGMITTNDRALAERVRLLRNHGAHPKYYHKLIGGNFRLDAIQAAVLRVKLNYLDRWSAARQKNAARYRQLFAEAKLEMIGLPVEKPERRHIYNQFVIRVAERDTLLAYLKQHNIGTEIYYPIALHLQECFANLGYRVGDFPESERAAKETLALPIYPELSDVRQRVVVDVIVAFCEEIASVSYLRIKRDALIAEPQVA